MGRKNQQDQLELLASLGDFTSKDNWDKFFTIRGIDDSFEWYAEWPQLKGPLLPLLGSLCPTSSTDSETLVTEPRLKDKLQILVPGCGNSRLSELLYDAGFIGITNIDFSTVVISGMLRRNVRARPGMRWRVMDMTSMQFTDETFDVVLDKGGLDALMEPELGPKLGRDYLSEVKRVLKSGGKYICLTLGESHVLGLLFSKFRFGWRMFIHFIPQAQISKPGLVTFMVVVEKDTPSSLHLIVSCFDPSSVLTGQDQAQGLCVAFDNENRIRREYLAGSSAVYSLEDLLVRSEGDFMELKPERRVQLTFGGEGDSKFHYRAVLLDAPLESGPFVYHCGVFLVPKARAHEWLFTTEEGQWAVVESSNAARLIMILLDSSHSTVSLDEIQKDISPIIKRLAPHKHDNGSQIPFMMASDGIKHRKIVHQDKSKLTGSMIVEDVVYETVDGHLRSLLPDKDMVFRRLVFQRTEGLVQSEALLTEEKSLLIHDGEMSKKKRSPGFKSKKREKQKTKVSQKFLINEKGCNKGIDLTFLVSSYHTGIIAGLSLISRYLESMASSEGRVEAVVLGLGAGVLPMFLHKCMSFFQIQVVELDPVVLNLARNCFGFCEDERMKVHLADGIQFVRNLATSLADRLTDVHIKDKPCDNSGLTSLHGSDSSYIEEAGAARKIDLLIIDVDSSDPSSGLSCPSVEFVEHAFFSIVKNILSKDGLFIINLVSRSPSIKNAVVSRMKVAFCHLYCLQLEEDVNEVLFALNSNPIEDNLSDAAAQLEGLLNFDRPERSQGIVNAAKKLKCLK